MFFSVVCVCVVCAWCFCSPPPPHTHNPPPQLLDAACVELGTNYPFPVVELAESRRLLDCAVDVVQAALKITTGMPSRGPYRPPTLNPTDPQAPAELRALYARFQQEVSSDAVTAVSIQRPLRPMRTASGATATEEVVSNFVAPEPATTNRSSAARTRGDATSPASLMPLGLPQQYVAMDTSAPSTSGAMPGTGETPGSGQGGPSSAQAATGWVASTTRPVLVGGSNGGMGGSNHVGQQYPVTMGNTLGRVAAAAGGSNGTETSLTGPAQQRQLQQSAVGGRGVCGGGHGGEEGGGQGGEEEADTAQDGHHSGREHETSDAPACKRGRRM